MKKQLKKIAHAVLGRDGARQLCARWWPPAQPFAQEIAAIQADPLNPQLHLALARRHLGRGGNAYTAYAEWKTAQLLAEEKFLPADANVISAIAVPRLEHLPHNQHFRFQTLANEIIRVAEGRAVRVLDVGGGQGQLARFLPDTFLYSLAEPLTNGISGEHLPFADQYFDIVVACHVLEHVPQEARTTFLDSLARTARHAVILLNPFDIPGSLLDAEQRLMYEITNAAWAKEHIDCVVPTRQSIEDYARSCGYPCRVEFNGTSVLALASVFVDHFAAQAGQLADWQKVQEFFNRLPLDSLHSARDPNALLVTMWLGK